jgi:hypothetical protein
MLNVFITVDTEVSPSSLNFGADSVAEDVGRDIYGRTADGDFGLAYQLGLLWEHELKAVFFVESLFAEAMGIEPLAAVVGAVREAGCDVQHHLHTEWVGRLPGRLLEGPGGKSMRDFPYDKQLALLKRGVANLLAAGAGQPVAFRAGGFGANNDTLRALAATGHLYDSSYNACWLNSTCSIRTARPLLQPAELDGVVEFPVTHFRDLPGHCRHLQLGSCSSGEIEQTLRRAEALGWYCVVLVSHSFELVRRPRRCGELCRPDPIAIRRFRRLCEFLAANREAFRTATFDDLDPAAVPLLTPRRAIRTGVLRTGWRYSQQLARRLA